MKLQEINAFTRSKLATHPVSNEGEIYHRDLFTIELHIEICPTIEKVMFGHVFINS